MNEKLDKLRAEIRSIDDQLLALVSERMRLARQVGQVKLQKKLPIKNYQVERDVLTRSKEKAAALGLMPELAEELTRLLITHSVQEQDRFKTRELRATPGTALKRVLIAGGRGRMGRWLSEFFESFGHQVMHYEPPAPLASAVKTDENEFRKLHHDLASVVQDAEVIVLSAPISATAGLLDALTAARPKALVFDICSLKSPIIDAIGRARDAGLKIASLHPMFGPNAVGLAGRNIVLCDCGNAAALDEMRALFADTTATLVTVDLQRHDELMTYVLGLAHMTSLVFAKTLASSPFDNDELSAVAGTTFRAQLEVTSPVLLENQDLYYEIQAENAWTSKMLGQFEASLQAFTAALAADDRDAFKSLMNEARKFLQGRATTPPP